jgi:hypothetical protein
MFFLITDHRDDRFPQHYHVGNARWLNTDAGWTELWTPRGQVFYKGYVLGHRIDRHWAQDIIDNPLPRYQGSFVAVTVQDQQIVITHDVDRAFPLWWNDSPAIGNIGLDRKNPVWADAVATLHVDNSVTEQRWEPVRSVGPALSLDQAADIVYNRLVQTYQWLTQRVGRRPRVFFSGGIDTLTCIAILRELGIEHDMVWCEHFDYDQFTCEFLPEMRSHPGYWGYQQIHHWTDHTCLITGGNGDENFMRGPATANMMLMHLGVSVEELLAPTDYHYEYFRKPKNIALYQQQANDIALRNIVADRAATVQHIIDINMNDHQHWHLGHTTTFTPFKDAEILRTVLSMDADSLLRQIANAELQKKIIQKAAPELLQYLSPLKNETLKSIWQLYEKSNP